MKSDSLGPIGHWVLAELMNQVSPPLAASIAQRGGEHLSREAFDRDISLLTANCTTHLRAPIHAACSLSDEELASIGKLVLEDSDQLVRAIQLLRESQRADANAALLPYRQIIEVESMLEEQLVFVRHRQALKLSRRCLRVQP